jgi:hypothetical protein
VINGLAVLLHHYFVKCNQIRVAHLLYLSLYLWNKVKQLALHRQLSLLLLSHNCSGFATMDGLLCLSLLLGNRFSNLVIVGCADLCIYFLNNLSYLCFVHMFDGLFRGREAY